MPFYLFPFWISRLTRFSADSPDIVVHAVEDRLIGVSPVFFLLPLRSFFCPFFLVITLVGFSSFLRISLYTVVKGPPYSILAQVLSFLGRFFPLFFFFFLVFWGSRTCRRGHQFFLSVPSLNHSPGASPFPFFVP